MNINIQAHNRTSLKTYCETDNPRTSNNMNTQTHNRKPSETLYENEKSTICNNINLHIPNRKPPETHKEMHIPKVLKPQTFTNRIANLRKTSSKLTKPTISYITILTKPFHKPALFSERVKRNIHLCGVPCSLF